MKVKYETAKSIAEPLSDKSGLPQGKSVHIAQIMLLICAAIWGGSYVSSKYALEVFPVQWLMGVRMVGACAIMAVIFFGTLRKTFTKKLIVPSLLTGITYYATLVLQTEGLRSIDPGRSAFLTAAYCVITPFSAWLIVKKKPTLLGLVAAVMCVAGVGFVALKPGMLVLTLSYGDFLTLLCAVVFAFNLTFLAYYSRKYNPVTLTFGQFVVSGVLFVAGALIYEPLPNFNAADHFSIFANMFYLTVVVTVVAQIMQNYSLVNLSTANASVIMCTESLFTLLFSTVLFHEHVSSMAFVGFALIFAAIITASLGEHYCDKKANCELSYKDRDFEVAKS
ncbi:DMT family transporter [Gardnerella swidsinskii]|uniref:DMT family transporter n=1 Tax=Gardnerella swidsinskii TaxID=2792979 RepID=UPI0036F454FA